MPLLEAIMSNVLAGGIGGALTGSLVGSCASIMFPIMRMATVVFNPNANYRIKNLDEFSAIPFGKLGILSGLLIGTTTGMGIGIGFDEGVRLKRLDEIKVGVMIGIAWSLVTASKFRKRMDDLSMFIGLLVTFVAIGIISVSSSRTLIDFVRLIQCRKNHDKT